MERTRRTFSNLTFVCFEYLFIMFYLRHHKLPPLQKTFSDSMILSMLKKYEKQKYGFPRYFLDSGTLLQVRLRYLNVYQKPRVP